ncbi:sensor histidine kinase [Streptomyces sp. NBC_01283]|uniref:sensor histidine kinase n=1 Tax=Streptomyces sp. NBC_01283 TaxID=2903812 RepID=UPI00352F25BC|nr:sensor histidine kinase [Streptomyces sp. NBC_01283]
MPGPDLRMPDPDARWLAAVMHAAFYLLLGASLARFLLRHPGGARVPWIIALSVVLAVLYALPPLTASLRAQRSAPHQPGHSSGYSSGYSPGLVPPGARPNPRRLTWLALVVGVWLVLVVLAPSFAWCAVPLFFAGLRTLPPRPALVLVAVLTGCVIASQLRLAGRYDPDSLLAPPAVSAIATAVFVHMRRQAVRQRELIDDLIRTRRELAATERREGTLAERQRISMEIHDTLAQGLSSQQMLLQAADRVWDADPAKARAHVRTAESITELGLTEARRFVHDLAPADLADGGGLDEALRTLAARTAQDTGLTVRFHSEGTPAPLPDRTQSALLRIAQGALANVTEHADATTAALTLTHLDDQVVLDIADDGRGFTPTDRPPASDRRGHGLPAIRARVRQLGGTLTIESAPGEGTVLSVATPLSLQETPPSPQETS